MTNKISDLEKRFLKSNFIEADAEYITDGFILINKNFISNKCFKKLVTTDNIWKDITKIPYEKGEYWEPFVSGRHCFLDVNSKIKIKFSDQYMFDYQLVKEVYNQVPIWDICEFTVATNEEGTPYLKLFNGDDEFIGVIPPCQMIKEQTK